jgi:tRNA A-37 threonylcarbamoyl transferase component Bud32
MSREDAVICVALKQDTIRSKATRCSNHGSHSWEVASEISSGTSYGVVYQACCERDCTYILKYQKFNVADPLRPPITAETIKNEVMMQSKAAEQGLAPEIYDSWVCNNGGVIIMAPMKKSVSALLEIYRTEEVRKIIVDSVFDVIGKLHAKTDINHGDAHLDNIMVTYGKLPLITGNELKDYLAHKYNYKFIDFGVAEELNPGERNKQMIGDYSKVVDWIGTLARNDASLYPIKEYAEEKTRKLAIQYGLIKETVDDDEDWSDDD